MNNKIQEIKIEMDNKYKELNRKYVKLWEINIDNRKRDLENQKKFDSYSEKIKEIITCNKDMNNNTLLSAKIEQLNIELDKKSSEISLLKNYIHAISLEIDK